MDVRIALSREKVPTPSSLAVCALHVRKICTTPAWGLWMLGACRRNEAEKQSQDPASAEKRRSRGIGLSGEAKFPRRRVDRLARGGEVSEEQS